RGIDDDVSAPEASRAERHAEPPEVFTRTLRIDDRPRRGKDPLQERGLDGEEPSERRLLRLERGKVVLSRDGDFREIVEGLDVAGRDSGLLERAADMRRSRMRVSDGVTQTRAQIR